jgi:hypothetical protein
MGFVGKVPGLDDGRPEAWRPVLFRAEVLAQTWADLDPSYADLAAGHYWARVGAEAAARADQLNGAALELLPAQAVPHVRAAAAAEALKRAPAGETDLAAWVSRLSSDLAKRDPQGPPGNRTDRGLKAERDLWPTDRDAADGAVPAVVYLGGSRRALGATEDADLAICVLEAAARVEPARVELLEQGLEHPDALVQWTAKRLEAAL